ncbi:MAG: FAD:protein FMN transferase [Deltaproteobacteria bacterium]|nr:FAD:protein FMN transferase [Deltaproteobacteria bacterium]
MGTSWWIGCDRRELLPEAEALVHALEARLSRFAPGSDLSRLNRLRVTASSTLAAVVREALRLDAATGGAFDPTLGAELAALGYDRSYDRLAPRVVDATLAPTIDHAAPPTRVLVDGDRVALEGPGALDLGGIAKGWTVDRVLALLVSRGASAALVDGGGDLRGHGAAWPIGVGDDLVVSSAVGAIATSSTRSRRWRDARGVERHHILDARTRLPSDGPLDTATVIAPDTATADALATALLAVADLPPLLARLPALGAHALVRTRAGRWLTTPHAPIGAPLDAPRSTPFVGGSTR